MPPISKQKRDKISEQIIHYLYQTAPSPQYTTHISREIARDEEFTLSLLKDLEKKSIVIPITKNPKGTSYLKRRRWILSNKVFQIYQSKQQKQF
jgi:hypothetical protein